MAELFQQEVQAGILGRAVDAAPAAVFVTDDEGGFVAANRYACQMLGREREELLSLHLADVAWGADSLSALDQGSAVGIAQLRHSDGSKVVARYQVRPLNNGDSPFAVWLATTRPVSRPSSVEAHSTRARDHDVLSAREIEILQLIADGLENEAIARELYISTETVKSHVRRILQKLGAHSRTYAVAVALRRALVD
jgi:PAS domain S-box-containing protein